MIDTLDPAAEFFVEFLKAFGPVFGQYQRGLKALLKAVKASFNFSLAPGGIRLGVKQPDAQVCADKLGVFVRKGPA
jgi:hypothetical protein